MSKTAAPKDGCFQAIYPSTTWVEVPCVKAPNRLLIPGHAGAHAKAGGAQTATVGGGGNADSSSAVSGTISWAEGSFPRVSGVTSESADGIANAYSLQLNTNTFSTSACSGATLPNCVGWEQFVYEGGGGGFIQYWLINYGNTCPTGWRSGAPTVPGDCFRDAVNSVSAPAEPITALSDIAVIGVAGSSDALTVLENNVVYMISQPSILGLNTAWTTAEFNIFGDSGGDEAVLNSGSTIVVQTLTDSVSPTTNAPTCDSVSFTGETNSLTLVSSSCCPVGGTLPGIQFEESNASSPSAQTCPLEPVNSQLVWYNGISGALQAWNVQDTTRTSFASFPSSLDTPASSGWAFVGSADFNGDGETDILAYDGTSGAFQVWYMSGVNRTSFANFASGLDVPSSTGWALVAIADFNADGHPDLLFNNGTSGALQVWYMNGITRTSAANLSSSLDTPASSGWVFVGAADFNQDGNPDVLAYNGSSGALQVWYMNGITRTSFANLSSSLDVPSSTGWAFANIADFNGDGQPDLLWYQGSSGAEQVWYMNGITRTSAANFSSSVYVPSSTGWSIVPHTDFVRVPLL
jgi:hypothetical protein